MTSVHDLVAEARRQIREIEASACAALSRHLIVDVREPAEYAAGHLPGAVNIPRGLLEFEADKLLAPGSDRDRPILVYCRSGARAALAAQTLHRLGFSQVCSIAGGIAAWIASGRPLAATADPPLSS